MSTRRELLNGLPQVRPLDRPDITFEPSDSMVVNAIFWFGVQGYEGILAELWARLCSKASSILEVVGFYSVIGGKSARRTYTVVEPVPEAAAVLGTNLWRNKLSRIEVVEAAAIAGSNEHDVCLCLPEEGRAMRVGAHLKDGVKISKRSISRNIVVKGSPVTQPIEGRDLIKIDAEDIEHELSTVAMPYIEQHKPAIVVEVLPESQKLAALIGGELCRRFEQRREIPPASSPIARI